MKKTTDNSSFPNCLSPPKIGFDALPVFRGKTDSSFSVCSYQSQVSAETLDERLCEALSNLPILIEQAMTKEYFWIDIDSS